MSKFFIRAALIGAALTAAPAFAQTADAPAAATADTPAAVKAGDTIYDPAGQPVGTIEAVNGATANLATGTVTVGIPTNAIVTRDKGPTIALTKAEVEAQAKAAAPPQG